LFRVCFISSIYSVFHNSLIDHLFTKQSPSLPQVDVSEVSMSTLHGQLECVEHRAGVNPIEAELHLGMRGVDIVGLAGGPRAKETTTTAAPAPAAAAAPTPKETLLGQARGASPERERKTAPYEQPIAPGRKEEREELEEKIPPKGQRGGKGEQ